MFLWVCYEFLKFKPLVIIFIFNSLIFNFYSPNLFNEPKKTYEVIKENPDIKF